MSSRRVEPGDASSEQDDISIVPGLGTGELPQPRSATHGLDPALDPDRFDRGRDGALDPRLDPDRYDPGRDSAPLVGLDPRFDPDRYDASRDPDLPPGQGQTLTELLGAGAYEDARDGWEWVVGLLAVLVFLGIVAFFFGSVIKY